jgi:RNA-dependent RNA polymerase
MPLFYLKLLFSEVLLRLDIEGIEPFYTFMQIELTFTQTRSLNLKMPPDTLGRAPRYGGQLDHSVIAPPSSRQQQQQRHGFAAPSREIAVALQQPEGWRNLNEVSIKIRNIALEDRSTFKIWEAFSWEGNLSYVELYVARTGNKDGNALIRFSPPPATAFWERNRGRYLFKGNRSRYLVDVELLPNKRGGQVQSPIRRGIWYDPVLRLVAGRIHFGIMIDPLSMMPLHVVESNTSKRVKNVVFEVDLLRHRIKASFNVVFYQQGQYDRINRYMLQIPFASLQKIQRMEVNDTGTFALIISLKSPPQFYRRREEIKAGHTNEGIRWSEFDTWYRQTDIVYSPYELKTKKVALHKDRPVIDIGKAILEFKKITLTTI